MRALKTFIRENKSILLFICLLSVFRGAIADWHPVPTGSMKPTILEGDVIWHNKVAYDLKLPFTNVRLKELSAPQRGDIVVVNSVRADKRLVKRLIGLPGDEISIINNQLRINGLAADYKMLPLNELAHIRPVDREPGFYAIEQVDGSPNHLVHARATQNVPYDSRFPTRGFRTVVPENHYFLMGDSRDNSADSRHYGSFPRDEIRGRATHVVLSMNMLDAYKPRFERFFERLL